MKPKLCFNSLIIKIIKIIGINLAFILLLEVTLILLLVCSASQVVLIEVY